MMFKQQPFYVNRTLHAILFLLVLLFPITMSVALQKVTPPPPKADSEKVPDMLLFLENSPEPQHAIIVEKETQQLFLYAYDGKYKIIFNTKCSTGENKGAKQFAGDKKTPEGVYFFTDIYEDKYLAPIYGVKAFPTDYPNLLDRLAGKNGDAIWLHGTNKPLKDRSSNGCVALENETIDRLAPYIILNKTPVIITQKISYTDLSRLNAEKETLSRFLYQWNDHLSNGTYHDYLSGYHADYMPHMSWWMEWKNLQADLSKVSFELATDLRNISIFKHNGIYVALFEQFIKAQTAEAYIGKKKLYFTFAHNHLRVIGDEYQVIVHHLKSNRAPIITAATKLKNNIIAAEDIPNVIDNWLDAWAAKDISAYGKYYSKQFRSNGMNRSQWLTYKKHVTQKYKTIAIKKENLSLTKDASKTEVRFIQKYTADRYEDVGEKYLLLMKEDGRWKIFRETWTEL